MNKYEAMFIVKPDMSEEEKKTLFGQINDSIAKNEGKVTQASVWSEKKKLYFPIKKCHEGLYYLINFTIAPAFIKDIRQAYGINENILRVLITKAE